MCGYTGVLLVVCSARDQNLKFFKIFTNIDGIMISSSLSSFFVNVICVCANGALSVGSGRER